MLSLNGVKFYRWMAFETNDAFVLIKLISTFEFIDVTVLLIGFWNELVYLILWYLTGKEFTIDILYTSVILISSMYILFNSIQ